MWNIRKLTSIFLWLITIHSFFVGILLIILPSHLISVFGFNEVENNFFQIQGGVFHMVVCFAYVAAALNPVQNFQMIQFAIFAKIFAFIFLFSYFLFVQSINSVLLSGIGDLLMGIILLLLSKRILQESKSA